MLLELALPDLTAPGPTASARLLLATVELLTGDVRRAEDTASTALTEFRRLGRAAWERRALDVTLRARVAQLAETGLDDGLLAECAAGADELEAVGVGARRPTSSGSSWRRRSFARPGPLIRSWPEGRCRRSWNRCGTGLRAPARGCMPRRCGGGLRATSRKHSK